MAAAGKYRMSALGSDHLKGFPNRLEICGLLPLEFVPDFLEASDGFFAIQALPAMQAHLREHTQNGCVHASAQKFFNLFLCEFTAADRAFLEGPRHDFFLFLQSIQR